MTDAVVVLRHFDPETDSGFIYSSWRNSSFYLRAAVDSGDPSSFFSDQTRRIREILKFADIRIACLEDSPLFIVGYSVCSGSHLDWIYVKVDYRGKGIGRLLTPKGTKTFTADVTRIGKVIAFKKNLTLKENDHAGSRSEARIEGSTPEEGKG